MIPQDFIDEVIARTDIVEIIDARVKLKKSGQNYSGLCPFHDEKTPSFSVSANKQFYHCFGCKASGNALKFLIEYDRMEFIAAIEFLASRCGLEVPRSGGPADKEAQVRRKSIYELLDRSGQYYKQQLKQHPERNIAVDYLKNRGVSGLIAREFGLGFAPPGWDNLYGELAKTNQERQLLIDAGMLIEREDTDRVYDRFRERIMFPIRDLRGRVIAFGGRIVGDGKPKYLNSPETPVFHKGRELYGLFEARKRNRKLDYLLVVEGYMDVVALAQHDINTAVATLGTATTSDHLERLYRMVSRVVFSFDGDSAGRVAAWKALLTALPHMRDGKSARFLFVPDGEDPDSLVRKEGADKFLERVEKAQNLADFFFQNLMSEVDMTALDGKAHLSQLAIPLIGKIPPGVFRELMVGKLSELTNLSADKLLQIAANNESAARKMERTAPAPSRLPAAVEPESGGSDQGMPDYGDLPPIDDYSDAEYAGLDGSDEGPVDYGFEDVGSSRQAPTEQADRTLAILLLKPELAADVPEQQRLQLSEEPGCGLLCQVLEAILSEDIQSPALLLARFHGDSAFEHLRGLAEREQLLPIEHLGDEFLHNIHKLASSQAQRARDLERRKLLAKPLAELTEAEKKRLKDLVAQSPQSQS